MGQGDPTGAPIGGSITFVPGDGLGMCIYKNTLAYAYAPKDITGTQKYLLISPATFSLKVTPS